MKLNNLTTEMKNIYGIDIINEEEVKQQIINFAMLKIEEFNSNKTGKELIFEVLNYVNSNFVFNSKNEITELRVAFLDTYKTDLINCLNPQNFKELTKYSDEEFYFITIDLWKILHYFSYPTLQNIEDMKKYNHLSNFKINNKSINSHEETIIKLISILRNKNFNLKDFKLFDKLFFCDNTYGHSCFLQYRNTSRIKELLKEKKAIQNYFKNKEPDFSGILSFLSTKHFSKEEQNSLNDIFMILINN